MGFFGRDHVGLSVGPTYLSIASAVQRGESVDIRHGAVEALEEGICRPSPVEKNILQVDRWRKSVQSVLERIPRVRHLTLALPDAAVRMVLLDLQQVPQGQKDLEKLIQWHMEKTFLYPLGESRFSYQVLSRGSSHTKILATAVKREVIEQYESLDEAQRIETRQIAPSSFYMFNLFRPLMVRTVGAAGQLVFVYFLDQSLTILIFDQGHLSFIRVKESPKKEKDLEGSTDFLLEEIGNSLSFYDGGGNRLQNLTHLFLLVEQPPSEVEARIQETFHLTPVFLKPAQIVRSFPSSVPESSEWSLRMVSAAAAAVGG